MHFACNSAVLLAVQEGNGNKQEAEAGENSTSRGMPHVLANNKRGPSSGTRISPYKANSSECQVQAELHIASIECSRSLSEDSAANVVVASPACRRQEKVGTVEDVEGLRFEL